jgi:hypothetical protein
MAKAGYSVVTGGAVALAAATAKTVLAVKAPTGSGIDLKKLRVGFDGTSASAVPVLVELCYITYATAGTSTDVSSSIRQLYGRAVTVGATASKAYTVEPTALTVLEEWLLTPAGGLVLYDWPLGDTPDSAVSEGFALRCTAPASVNVRAGLVWERT